MPESETRTRCRPNNPTFPGRGWTCEQEEGNSNNREVQQAAQVMNRYDVPVPSPAEPSPINLNLPMPTGNGPVAEPFRDPRPGPYVPPASPIGVPAIPREQPVPAIPHHPLPRIDRTTAGLPPSVPKTSPGGSEKGTIAKVIGTGLAAGKKAVLFVVSHPATPYAVGLAATLGICYYGYKWFKGDSDKEETGSEGGSRSNKKRD